ncbi:hypothetical protein K8R43_04775, partial [archaeon]|nr:hypothetical protein [archaeon]
MPKGKKSSFRKEKKPGFFRMVSSMIALPEELAGRSRSAGKYTFIESHELSHSKFKSHLGEKLHFKAVLRHTHSSILKIGGNETGLPDSGVGLSIKQVTHYDVFGSFDVLHPKTGKPIKDVLVLRKKKREISEDFDPTSDVDKLNYVVNFLDSLQVKKKANLPLEIHSISGLNNFRKKVKKLKKLIREIKNDNQEYWV